MKAREIIGEMGWSEVQPKKADFVLVVCRSGFYDPLNLSYQSYGELDHAADSQMNISGENYHVYIYRLNDDLSVDQVKHSSYPAND